MFLTFYVLVIVVRMIPKLIPDRAFSIPLFDDSSSSDIKHIGRHFFTLGQQDECIVCMRDYRR